MEVAIEQQDHNFPLSFYTPYEGQEFESENAAFNFYREYGGKVGFSIRKEYGNKDRNTGDITSRKFVCCKEGVRREDKRDHKTRIRRSETRTGCYAKMIVVLDRKTKKYRVTTFVAEHNHVLHISECMHMMRSVRKMSDAQACQVDIAYVSGITLKQSHELMGREAGGRENLGYTQEDQKSYLRSKRQKDMKYGEAGSLLRYFQQQLSENPSFYYAIQLDSEEQITNIFWADARMIIDYAQFGDVVTFDTTYKTNKEFRPCGVFAGFNHYRQVVIFGGALLYDETAESFQWLFESFLLAMSQKKPKTIFTDQDSAIAKALSLVMPETYHALCTWHLQRNALKHLGYLLKEGKGFVEDFSACVYDYDNETEFLNAWNAMLQKYNVESNPWLQNTFELKEKWAKVYMKRTCTLGMRTTQLSESLNSDLKDYLKPDLDLVQFFTHFNRVVDEKRYNELIAEYDSRQKLPNLRVKMSPILNHASKVYTPIIFNEFQKEFDASLGLVIKHRNGNEEACVYIVTPFRVEEKEYEVKSSLLSKSVSCNCKKFETKGILCSHALKVFEVQDIKLIPNQYILKRWTRNARNGTIRNIDGQVVQRDAQLKVIERYRLVCPNLIRIAARAAECGEAFDYLVKLMNDIATKIEEICSKQLTINHCNAECPLLPSSLEKTVEEKVNYTLLNGMSVKGIKKRRDCKGKQRLRSWVDKLSGKKKALSRFSSPKIHSPILYGETSKSYHPSIFQQSESIVDVSAIDVEQIFPQGANLFYPDNCVKGISPLTRTNYVAPTHFSNPNCSQFLMDFNVEDAQQTNSH